jgi:hypothetical protein
LGDAKRALVNYNTALEIDKNFKPAEDARDRLAQTVASANG